MRRQMSEITRSRHPPAPAWLRGAPRHPVQTWQRRRGHPNPAPCGHALGGPRVPMGRGARRPRGPSRGLQPGAPLLGVPGPVSGTGEFSDFEGKFNYVLSLTRAATTAQLHVESVGETLAHATNQKQNVPFQRTLRTQDRGPTRSCVAGWDTEEERQGPSPRPPRPRGVHPRKAKSPSPGGIADGRGGDASWGDGASNPAAGETHARQRPGPLARPGYCP